MWVDRIKSFTLYCPDCCFILTQVCVFSCPKTSRKRRRPDGTHSRSSLSSPPPPLAWACCLIYPWSSALPDTSESTLARRTCYYLVSRLLLCQKHTHKKRRGQFRWGDTGEITHFLFCFGERIPFELNWACRSVEFTLSCGHDLLSHQPWHSRQASQNPRGALCEEGPAGCWVYTSVSAAAAESLCERLISSHSTLWAKDALLPSSLDTRVTQWLY